MPILEPSAQTKRGNFAAQLVTLHRKRERNMVHRPVHVRLSVCQWADLRRAAWTADGVSFLTRFVSLLLVLPGPSL